MPLDNFESPPNWNILQYFQEVNGILQYKGQPINSGGSNGNNFTTLALNSSLNVTASGWPSGGQVPGNLQNFLDGDESTSTSLGLTAGAWNRGEIRVDFGQSYSRLLLETKLAFSQPTYPGGHGKWGISSSLDGVNCFPLWETTYYSPGASDKIFKILFLASNFRFIHFFAIDEGSGQAGLKAFDLKAWIMNLP